VTPDSMKRLLVLGIGTGLILVTQLLKLSIAPETLYSLAGLAGTYLLQSGVKSGLVAKVQPGADAIAAAVKAALEAERAAASQTAATTKEGANG
jgi:hypothetical protein